MLYIFRAPAHRRSVSCLNEALSKLSALDKEVAIDSPSVVTMMTCAYTHAFTEDDPSNAEWCSMEDPLTTFISSGAVRARPRQWLPHDP